MRELETRLADAESFVALRPKLQAKLTSQQTELIAIRRELADAQQLSQLGDSRVLDTQEQLEMAMLDKEVAEERAELAESELEEVKERLAVVEVELDVLREGSLTVTPAAGEGAESSGKNSLAYVQLEKQNERLKEALIRYVFLFALCVSSVMSDLSLRDISQETEQEQRRRISEMEKDMVGVDDLQCKIPSAPPCASTSPHISSAQLETSMIKLANAEIQIEDLKLQLDDALGAEEMLVQLTERNLMLGEVCHLGLVFTCSSWCFRKSRK